MAELLKKIPVIDCKTVFRFCEQQDHFVAVEVCKNRSEKKTRCYRCYEKWRKTKNQPALPFAKK